MRVLCVDDETTILGVMRRILDEDGGDYDVVSMRSACAAIEHLRSGEPYDVIVCDILMPDCTGFDLYKFLEEERPSLCNRVVFMTGGSMIPGIGSFLSSVNCPTLEKPFHSEDLVEVVRRVGSRP